MLKLDSQCWSLQKRVTAEKKSNTNTAKKLRTVIGEHEALCIDEALDARIEDAKYWGKISKVHHIRQEEESEMMKHDKEMKMR